eukprot:TRINITY_DN33078_c0_g1_i1.p1 TRINITY_DN33078_c0_g1~~TRINITY_DN33078_c0_g1_i1.p1  ORF type:complete len:1107 (+),score=185.49 TRINITY_DN33078_c0_g1_i1:54-3323(+)
MSLFPSTASSSSSACHSATVNFGYVVDSDEEVLPAAAGAEVPLSHSANGQDRGCLNVGDVSVSDGVGSSLPTKRQHVSSQTAPAASAVIDASVLESTGGANSTCVAHVDCRRLFVDVETPAAKKSRCVSDCIDMFLSPERGSKTSSRTVLKAWSAHSSAATLESHVSREIDSTTPVEGDDQSVDIATITPNEGYTLRDLRRIVDCMLPRYGCLLSEAERMALDSFGRLPLRAQKLYARLLSRKWPQWVRLAGLGSRYRELGEEEARSAVAELSSPSRESVASAADVASGCVEPWLLDTATETAATLLSRPLDNSLTVGKVPLDASPESYGKLLLEALPVAELRRLAKGLGMSGRNTGFEVKERLVARLCEVARRQRVLDGACARISIGGTLAECNGGSTSRQSNLPSNTTEARLIAQALRVGRWVCASPSPGHAAFAALSELFHLETCGVADSSFVVFSTRWPICALDVQSKTLPLFVERGELDAFLAARRLVVSLDSGQVRLTAERAAADAEVAESQLQIALEAVASSSPFERAKLHHTFRRRFTAAWCWAEALHHAIVDAPAAGADANAREMKIRRLRLLLKSSLCVSRRGRWYSELTKEVARAEGALQALNVAAEGLAEGAPPPLSVRVAVDLTADASQESARDVEERDAGLLPELPVLARDIRWDLASRCRSLACRLVAERKGGRTARSWHRHVRETVAAQAKATNTDDGGRWLVVLVERLIAEESAAAGPPRSIRAGALGLPSMRGGQKGSSGPGRRMFDGFDLEELTVEELALRYYLSTGGFDCGIHCEGALLRDLFGIVLFQELFDTSVEGVFLSNFQDAPLDLGTDAFYPSRSKALDERLAMLADFRPEELAEDVRACFSLHYGKRIRGVRWDRYEGRNGVIRQHGSACVKSSCSDCTTSGAVSLNTNGDVGDDDYQEACSKDVPPAVGGGDAPEDNATPTTASARRFLHKSSENVPATDCDIGAVAGAIGGRGLAAAMRLLCDDYNSAGLPDLLVWSWGDKMTMVRPECAVGDGTAGETPLATIAALAPALQRPRARFVEVKSERDILSKRQRLWLATLRSAGVEAEVCHVRDAALTGED